MTEKLALDTEIAVYKRLIDAMDKRLRLHKPSRFINTVFGLAMQTIVKYMFLLKFRGGFLSNGSLHSLIDNEIEAAVEEKKKEKVCFSVLYKFLAQTGALYVMMRY